MRLTENNESLSLVSKHFPEQKPERTGFSCRERVAMAALAILGISLIAAGSLLFVVAGWTAMPLLNVIFSLIVLGAVMLGAVLGKFLTVVKQPKQLSSKEFFIEEGGQKMAEIAKEESALAVRQALEEMEAILQSAS